MISSMWLLLLAIVLAVTPCLSQTCPITGCTADQCQTITVNATRHNRPGGDDMGGNFGRGGGGRGRGLLHGGGGRGFNGTVWTCASCDASANFQPVIDGPFNTTRYRKSLLQLRARPSYMRLSALLCLVLCQFLSNNSKYQLSTNRERHDAHRSTEYAKSTVLGREMTIVMGVGACNAVWLLHQVESNLVK